MSTKTKILNGFLAILFAAAVIGYANRAMLRDAYYEWRQPDVPEAVSFEDFVETTVESEATEEPARETATSSPSESEREEPVKPSADLPPEIQLDVPFLLQAPKQNWVQPFSDACEEASLLMVHAYYTGKDGDFAEDEGVEVIQALADYEDEAYGHNKDTTTEEVSQTAENYFGYETVLVREVRSANDIKEMLAKGYPVIVPAYGKALGNPNFRNGGPDYHMLVVKGYTADGYWITNDPGTRRGKGYVYREDVLMNALHEFHPEHMTKGAKRMIVLVP